MNNTTPKPQTLEEIVFCNRNQLYGAFAIRKSYGQTIKKATVLGIFGLSVALCGPWLYAQFSPQNPLEHFRLVDAIPVIEPPKDEPIVPETPPPPPVKEQVKTIDFPPLEVTIDADVPDNTEVPTQDKLSTALIGSENIDGISPNGDEPIVIDENPVKEVVTIVTPDETTEFVIVEQQPEFPGGMKKLMEFLGKNIKYPSGASASGVQGKVFLSFVVSASGDIYKLELAKGIGFGCDEEALRVAKLMPKWKPGKQSGRAVAVKFTLPVSFLLE